MPPRQRRRDLNSRQYRKQRAAFLAAWIGPCYWCRTAPGTTIDHVLPVDTGHVDPLEMSNWVAACRRCNSQRGAIHGNAKPKPPRRRGAAGFAEP